MTRHSRPVEFKWGGGLGAAGNATGCGSRAVPGTVRLFEKPKGRVGGGSLAPGHRDLHFLQVESRMEIQALAARRGLDGRPWAGRLWYSRWIASAKTMVSSGSRPFILPPVIPDEFLLRLPVGPPRQRSRIHTIETGAVHQLRGTRAGVSGAARRRIVSQTPVVSRGGCSRNRSRRSLSCFRPDLPSRSGYAARPTGARRLLRNSRS